MPYKHRSNNFHKIFCNYCHKPNHTYIEFRSRIRDNKFANNNDYKNRQYQQPQTSHTNEISTNDNVDATSSEFPFCFTEEAEASTISMADVNVTNTKLLKINATLDMVALKDEKSTSVYALVDGGATNSFLSPDLFNTYQQSNIFNDRSNKRQKFVIHGATGSAKSDCLVVKAKIQIRSYSGYHEFFIASSVKKHDAIIGRDFLNNFKPNSSFNNCLVEDTIVIEPNSQRLIKWVRNNFHLPT